MGRVVDITYIDYVQGMDNELINQGDEDMNKPETVLKSDGESEWVELVEGSESASAIVVIDWIGGGRTRQKGGPSADQAMKMAIAAAETSKAEKDADVSARAEEMGICPTTQKIIDHSHKGWILKKNALGDYRMDGPGRFDGSFCVSGSAAESAISNGVMLV